MQVYKIEPCGFCFGVQNAIQKITELRNNTPQNIPVYSLGKLIHNDIEISRLAQKGITTLEKKDLTRDELLDEVKDGIVVFTAHGVSEKVYEKAKNKKLSYLDCTCPKVLKVHRIIQDYLSKGYRIIYIGKKSHPETEGILGISSEIVLIENSEQINRLDIPPKNKIFSTNQTTLDVDFCDHIYQLLKIKYPLIEINNSLCTSTYERQTALKNYVFVDLMLVIGDPKSSNTLSLLEYSRKLGIKSCLISSLSELKDLEKNVCLFKDVKKIGVTSGASTPIDIIDQVIGYLNSVQE